MAENRLLYEEEDAPVTVAVPGVPIETGQYRDKTGGIAGQTPGIPDQEPVFRDTYELAVDDRRAYLGGSDAAAVLGLSPWKSPVRLWQEKHGDIEAEDLTENERVYFGTVLEAFVADEYVRRTGKKVRRVNKILRSKTHPFMCAHLDRIILDGEGILECKTSGSLDGWGDDGTDQIRDYYFPQIQHYLAVTGRQYADVPVLFYTPTFRVYRVDRDDDYINALVSLEKEFWERVENGEPPRPEENSDASRVWPRVTEGDVFGSEADLRIALALRDCKAELADLGKKKDSLELTLKKAIGAGESLMVNGKRIATWKEVERTDLDRKGLTEAHPEIVKQFTVTSTYRRFNLLVR